MLFLQIKLKVNVDVNQMQNFMYSQQSVCQSKNERFFRTHFFFIQGNKTEV
jgi:hypothetical protein